MCPAGTLKGEPVLKILDSEISKALTPNSILHILEFFPWGAQGGGGGCNWMIKLTGSGPPTSLERLTREISNQYAHSRGCSETDSDQMPPALS